MFVDASGAHILTCVIIKILESKGLNLKLPLALVLNYPALDFNFTSWMSEDHLKVLRAEDTSGYLSSGGRIDDMRVSEHEDYMHFNTLSMVGSDDRENRRGQSLSTTGMRRNRSWVATLKDFAVGDRSDDRNPIVAEGSGSPQKLRLRRSTPSLKGLNNGVVTSPQQTLGFTSLKTETKPSHSGWASSRPTTLPESQSSVTTTGHDGKLSTEGEGSEQTNNGSPTNSNVAHICSTETGGGGPFNDQDENRNASIGRGRLTMTSRTGYFQDRIIPPSMVGLFEISSQSFGSLTAPGSDACYGNIVSFKQEPKFQYGLPGISDYDSERDPSTVS